MQPASMISVVPHRRRRTVRVVVRHYSDGTHQRTLVIDNEALQRELKRDKRTTLEPIRGTKHEANRATELELESLIPAQEQPATKREKKPKAIQSEPEEAPAKPEQKAKPRKANAKTVVNSHHGELVAAGVERRTKDDRSFNQYCVDVRLDETGAIERTWGADLERALKASGAQVGDQVEVRFLGFHPHTVVRKNRKTGQKETKEVSKRVFEIERL